MRTDAGVEDDRVELGVRGEDAVAERLDRGERVEIEGLARDLAVFRELADDRAVLGFGAASDLRRQTKRRRERTMR